MKKIIAMIFGAALVWGNAMAMDDMAGHDMTGETGKTFRHEAVSDGVKAKFQIMSLASMNMTDPEGKTHHIMVKFMDEKTGEQIRSVAGKIKVIAPSKKEQEGSLKDYSGVYASNFTFDEMGKYGVICLIKAKGKKAVFKFWYPHHPM